MNRCLSSEKANDFATTCLPRHIAETVKKKQAASSAVWKLFISIAMRWVQKRRASLETFQFHWVNFTSVQSNKITGDCIYCFFHFSGISFLYFTKALVHDSLKVSRNWPLLCILSVRITTIWIFVSTRISLIIKRKFSLPWQVIYLNLKKEIWSIVFFHILSLSTSSLLNKAKLLWYL